LTGPNAIAGEWGHNPLPWVEAADRPLPRCYCGKHGCIETYLSGPAMAADHLAQHPDTQPAETQHPDTQHAETASARGIAARAARGDEVATATLARYIRRLAKSLASVINVLDPDVVVLGGGVSNIDALYPGLAKELPPWVFSDEVGTRIVRAHHGDSSGVRGAAWLWPGS
jgi:fructokinase